MNINVPVTKARATVQAVEQMLVNAGANPASFILQPKVLSITALLDPNTNTYSFNLRQGGAPVVNPDDTFLPQSDLFIADSVALGIRRVGWATGNVYSNWGNHPIFYCPDPNYFGGTNEAASLETLYNGSLEFLTTPTSRVQKLDTTTLRYVGFPTYQLPPTGLGQVGASPAEQNISNAAFELGVRPVIIGQQDNVVQLTLGTGSKTNIDNSTGSPATRNTVVLKVIGLNVVNGATSQSLFLNNGL